MVLINSRAPALMLIMRLSIKAAISLLTQPLVGEFVTISILPDTRQCYLSAYRHRNMLRYYSYKGQQSCLIEAEILLHRTIAAIYASCQVPFGKRLVRIDNDVRLSMSSRYVLPVGYNA
jgi:hypothetical protein